MIEELPLAPGDDNIIPSVSPSREKTSILLEETETHTFPYPTLRYPMRVIALDLHKAPHVAGTLLGIKGQTYSWIPAFSTSVNSRATM